MGKPIYPSMKERLLANREINELDNWNGTPCWLWTGAKDRYGYGTTSVRWKSGPRKGKVRTLRVHRLAIKIFKNQRMAKRYVGRHLCNNRLCFNPEHLKGGSVKSNNRDTVKAGRHRNMYGATGSPYENLRREDLRGDEATDACGDQLAVPDDPPRDHLQAAA
jgi:hypothetical protein